MHSKQIHQGCHCCPDFMSIFTHCGLNRGRREGGTCAKKHQVQQTEDDLPFYIHDCSKLWLGVSLEPHVWFSNDYMFWKEEGKPDKWRKALIFNIKTLEVGQINTFFNRNVYQFFSQYCPWIYLFETYNHLQIRQVVTELCTIEVHYIHVHKK